VSKIKEVRIMRIIIETETYPVEIDGYQMEVDEGMTILDAAHGYGIHIPTVCYMEGLTPYGGCRICSVEVSTDEGKSFKVAASCSYEIHRPVIVKTDTPKIRRIRKMLAELMVASAPNVKLAQDIAARFGINEVRFKMEDNRCILCGLCVRICDEHMGGKALGFAGRGPEKRISAPFAIRSELCLNCGGCDSICPGKMIPCQGISIPGVLCGKCMKPDEMPFCCPTGTFGCFCENNPLEQ
jgi:NADH dehydrogenase/NADH:ubiquinone oxidoreductase subunit G